ncbi:MAG: hypothetical protein KDA31_10350 [Phycisphaerales bacterium]|nr:hypothetical protein [Phycisphaerales bacterium]MCB9837500.1 hypothetical protein [Phycisphaera sp.]
MNAPRTLLTLALTLLATFAHAQSQTIDDFETIDAWSTFAPEGVRVEIKPDRGALRIDYAFERGGGFAIVKRAVNIDVVANYAFNFRVRGDAPANDLEFKLIDATGDNVWWHNRRRFTPPSQWQTLTSSRRVIEFAWGPTPDRTLHHVAGIEFAIASATGGKGTIWIDDLRFAGLPEPLPLGAPVTLRRAASGEVIAERATPGEAFEPVTFERGLEIDLASPRPLGGLVMGWSRSKAAFEYAIQGRTGDGSWVTLRDRVQSSSQTGVVTFDAETIDRVRLVPTGDRSVDASLTSLAFLPIEAHENANRLVEILAQSGERTHLPSYFTGRRTFWTVSGLPGKKEEALLDEDGAFEPVKAGPRLQPAIIVNGELHGGWDADTRTQSLLWGWMPIPTATWSYRHLTVETQVIPLDDKGGFSAYYKVTNTGEETQDFSLVLALRPFQVLPQWQFLNTVGGVAPIDNLIVMPLVMTVERKAIFYSGTTASRVAASPFGAGEIMQRLAEGSISTDASARVEDPAHLASGAWIYDLTLKPGQSRKVIVRTSPREPGENYPVELVHAQRAWNDLLGRFWLHLPESQRHLEDSVRASIAYALVNQDGPAIQPGSRSYERTWIRDGSLTSHAMLSAGLHGIATGFIDWYSGYLFENGKAPCCVDHRGSDPVDEHDSTGQYIHTVWSCYAFTRDTSLLERHYVHVQRAMAYIESLRAQRMGAPYNDPNAPEHVFYGLVPESISHEGYSAKPMHSYWDDFFVLLGISDAANIARELGRDDDAKAWADLEADFRKTLAGSIALSMRQHNIDYIPGCAELGDFDATSTAIAAFPVWELGSLPKQAVDATFDRYWKMFVDRRDGNIEWRDYTPYEVRVIGAMTDMGRPERSHEMIDYFLSQQTPTGWRQWPEVVHRDVRGPGFIGDLPHSWVACDFVNSITSMLVGVNRHADRVTLARGLRLDWLEGEGLRVDKLSTPLGRVSWSGVRHGDRVSIDITQCERTPTDGLWLDLRWLPTGATVVGRGDLPAELRIDELPAHVEVVLPGG